VVAGIPTGASPLVGMLEWCGRTRRCDVIAAGILIDTGAGPTAVAAAPERVPGVGQATKVAGSYDVIVTGQARSVDELAGPESADAGSPRRRTPADLPGRSAVESRSP
jgi:hypothetical protein